MKLAPPYSSAYFTSRARRAVSLPAFFFFHLHLFLLLHLLLFFRRTSFPFDASLRVFTPPFVALPSSSSSPPVSHAHTAPRALSHTSTCTVTRHRTNAVQTLRGRRTAKTLLSSSSSSSSSFSCRRFRCNLCRKDDVARNIELTHCSRLADAVVTFRYLS